MSDSYQAVYDAVRSRFGFFDPAQAIRDACHLDASWAIEYVKNDAVTAIESTRQEMQRPSVLFKPAIGIDGDKWCALYGANLQEGVAGFGDSPAAAMLDFDKQWNANISPKDQP